MEILRFDSRKPTSKYGSLIAMLEQKLATVQVITPSPALAFHVRGTYFDDRMWSPRVSRQISAAR
jgi:hypothetical protein